MASKAAVDADEAKDPIASIGGQMPYLSTGGRARLRRMYLTKSYGADGVVIELLHRAGCDLSSLSESFDQWRLIAHAAAVLSGTGANQPHAPGRRLGTALQAAGYSENRLLRLTSARGQPLYDQIKLVARLLAQAGQAPVNLWTLFDLAGHHRDKAEEARLRIAQDYYAAQARSEGDSQ